MKYCSDCDKEIHAPEYERNNCLCDDCFKKRRDVNGKSI